MRTVISSVRVETKLLLNQIPLESVNSQPTPKRRTAKWMIRKHELKVVKKLITVCD